MNQHAHIYAFIAWVENIHWSIWVIGVCVLAVLFSSKTDDTFFSGRK